MTAKRGRDHDRPRIPPGYGPDGHSEWLEIDWRRHQRWVPVAGAPVNVVEMGDGVPLLLLHGLGGSWQNWLENIPRLARSFRVIALDLPGFGASPMPAGPISIGSYGRIVDELCAELGVGCAHVVGNSMGGFIATELAIAFPTRVDRLVLVSAAGISTDRWRRPILPLVRRATALAAWVATHSEAVARRPRLRQAALFSVARHPTRLPAALSFEQIKGSGKPGFVDAYADLSSYDIKDRIPEIACPVLLVWGEKDILVPDRDAHEFQRLIPHARLVVLPDTGHVAQLERPSLFNSLIEEFLATGDGAAGRAQRVTAPSEALDTSLAYLARAPGGAPPAGGR